MFPCSDAQDGAEATAGSTLGYVDDRELVAAMRAGDPGGLAGVYDAYADRLYTYCLSLLRDPDSAADVVHDTFVVAARRVGQLRDPDRLRSWLYAVARNECLRQLRSGKRLASLEEAGDVRDDSVNPEGGLRDEELRSLVWQAADGLNPRDRSVLELSVRHGLEGRELAAALGVSVKHTHALLSRARRQLERALAALVVARTGRGDCPELAAIVDNWDGRMTVLLRKRVTRHIESCSTCEERRRATVSGPALLGTLPIIAAPAELRAQVLEALDDARLVAQHEAIGDRAGSLRGDGFPRTPRGWAPPTSTYGATAAVAGAVLLVALASSLVLWRLPVLDPLGVAASPSPSPTTSPEATSSTPLAVPLTGAASTPPATLASTPVPQPTVEEVPSPELPPATSSPQESASTPTSVPPTTPTASTPTPQGVLTVERTQAQVTPDSPDTVVLRASKAAVQWEATVDPQRPYVAVTPGSGVLEPGESVQVELSFNPDTGAPPNWTTDVVFAPGAVAVTVSGASYDLQ